MDSLTRRIVQAEISFPKTFADVHKRAWGVLFVTPSIPDSYDGNHASVLNFSNHLKEVVGDIVSFYEDRGLTPRVNHVASGGNDYELRSALLSAGFTIGGEDAMQTYLYRGPSLILPNPDAEVRRHDGLDDEMVRRLSLVENLRFARVLQRKLTQPDCWLFTGEIDGSLVSTALLERVGNIWRVDGVHTAADHRGQGFCRAVMHAVVAYFERHIYETLYLWTDNPVAERIYREAGFNKLELRLTNWHSWRE